MNIFLSNDRLSYRRWINIIPSAVLVGAGQYLSGRRRAGWFWFIAFIAYTGTKFILVGSPWAKLELRSPLLSLSDFVFIVCLCADACRRPIPRLGFKRWLALLALAAGILLLPLLAVRQFVLTTFHIPARGMQPTLMGETKSGNGRTIRGDSIMVDRLSYRFREPRRGELVVFKTKGLQSLNIPQDEFYVKRLAGLPGERVSIHPPFLYINGHKVTTPEVFNKIASGFGGHSGYLLGLLLKTETDEITLGSDEYFVLGDNTDNSLDGRYFGPIRRNSIIGKVAWIYAPLERKGYPE